MAISGLQIIDRLLTSVRLLIDHRDGVDSFKLYWSATEGGVYSEFADVLNGTNNNPALRGRISYMFFPDDEGMANDAKNYIKLAPVIGGVPGALEGPAVILTREQTKKPVDIRAMAGYNSDQDKYIPIAVDEDGKIITA